MNRAISFLMLGTAATGGAMTYSITDGFRPFCEFVKAGLIDDHGRIAQRLLRAWSSNCECSRASDFAPGSEFFHAVREMAAALVRVGELVNAKVGCAVGWADVGSAMDFALPRLFEREAERLHAAFLDLADHHAQQVAQASREGGGR